MDKLFLNLPVWLQSPVLLGALSVDEAHQILELSLQSLNGQPVEAPPELWSAAQRLWLFELEPPKNAPLQ